jgi:16S rRNA (guanine527-N7)-methyltransferase
VITCRAFASLHDFLASTRPLLAAGGFWMAMKGKPPNEELIQLGPIEFHVEPLVVPALGAERCLVWIRPNDSK